MSGPKRSTRRSPAKPRRVRVRMYDVGFGDAFLVTFPSARGARHVLIDCGFHTSGRGAFTEAEIARRIAEDCGGHLHLVVCTHRHQDHIVGFGAKEPWSEVTVDEVWMPWTEDPDDPGARKLWSENDAAIRRVRDFLGEKVPEVVDFLLWNATSNADAMDTLYRGFKNDCDEDTAAARRYLPEAGEGYPQVIRPKAIPGVRVHVLGPSRDWKDIRALEPRAGEAYELLRTRQRADGDAPPFDDAFRVTVDEAPQALLREAELRRWEKPKHAMEGLNALSDFDALGFGAATSRLANGTSLVLAFEFKEQVLLFPGDAQMGTWRMVFREGNEDAAALVSRATFLKVGHHGSHNATPKALVGALPQEGKIPAMISTQEGDGSFRNRIPLPSLVRALSERAVVVRSDEPRRTPEPFSREAGEDCVDLFLDA